MRVENGVLIERESGSGGIEKSHSCKWTKWIQWHALPHIQQSTQQRNKGHNPHLHGWDFSIPPSPRKQRIPAPLFGSKSDENSDFEGVKQEEFDALKNGDFYYDYGSEFYSARETKNLCYSRVNSEWRAVQCYTNDVQRNERSCSDLCRVFTLKLRQFPWLFTG